MSYLVFWGVILSDERSEESKDPFARQQSQTCCLRHAATLYFLAAIGVLRLRARPTRKRGGSEILCGRSAQDDTSRFMNNPASAVGKHPTKSESRRDGRRVHHRESRTWTILSSPSSWVATPTSRL